MNRAKTMVMCLLLCLISMNAAVTSTDLTCGSDPDVHRYLLIGPEAMSHFPIAVRLLAVQMHEGGSRVLISIGERFFSSTDKGRKWRSAANDCDGRQIANADDLGGCVMSNADPNTFYRQAFEAPHGADLDVSHDGGNSWKQVHPAAVRGRHLGSVRIVATGMRNPCKIYAQVSTVGERGMFVSDDCGETFKPLAEGIRYLVESRVDAKRLYGIADGLVVSIDGGATWRSFTSGKDLISPLYMDSLKLLNLGCHVRSWKEDGGEKYGVNVKRIETDPHDAATFYILTSKGLFRTRDAGKTFRLLSLASDRVNGIQTIAVDPIDGRYLFAIVRGKDVVRSEDYGCSWQKVEMPK